MGLSGTLEAFPLSEVLRLLGRSGQTGRLIARSGEKEMRAYLQAGQLVVAWAGNDDALGEELIGRGLIDQVDWDDVSSGAVACEQALQDGVSALDFDHAILDITIEGLAKMVDGREGTFAFEEGEVTDLRLETEIELDAVLEGVDERLKAWRRLRQIVPDTSQPLEFLRVTAGTPVELSDRAWNLLVQMLPRTALDELILDSGRTSTAFVEDLLELFASDLATIEGFTPPDEVDAALRQAEAEDEGDDAPSMVPEDPLAGAGPMGWDNELASIAAADGGDAEEDDDSAIPLLEGEEAGFLTHAKEADGFDFGLVGIDVGPVKGRNLLEKDDSWTGILGGESQGDDDEPQASPDPVDEARVDPEPGPVIDLGLDSDVHDDDLLGSVLNRLDEVLADDDDDEPEENHVEPVEQELPVYEPEGAAIEPSDDWDPHADASVDEPEEPNTLESVELEGDFDADDGADTETDDLLAVVAALEGELDDDVEIVEDEPEDVVEITEEEPMLLERVAELLEEAGELLPDDVEVVPYDAEVVDEATADAEPEEPHPADAPAPGMSNLLRNRARGALAKELRSLSD